MSTVIGEVPLEKVWQLRQEVMYPGMNQKAVKLSDDAEGLHLGLFTDGQLCSVISLFTKGDSLQFRKYATVSDLQGRGYGTRLLKHVFQLARENGTRRIWCNARTTATGLYRKFGMQPIGERWEANGYQYIKMQIEL